MTGGREEGIEKDYYEKITKKQQKVETDQIGGMEVLNKGEQREQERKWSNRREKVKKSQEVEAMSRDELWALQACCIMWNYRLHKQRIS